MTIGFRVPRSAVFLIIGSKGQNIQRMQAETNTFIISPPQKRANPVFEVTGTLDSIRRVQRMIKDIVASKMKINGHQEVSSGKEDSDYIEFCSLYMTNSTLRSSITMSSREFSV